MSGNRLTELPAPLFGLTDLLTLNASNNRIRAVSSRIAELKNLCWLYLENNALTSLPDEIGALRRLIWLSLRRNKLSDLAGPLTGSRVKDLCVAGNPLTTNAVARSNLKKALPKTKIFWS